MIDRRVFLGAGLAATGWLALGSAWSQQGTLPNLGAPALPAVGYRRHRLGEFELIALHDGAVRRPLGEEFVRNVPLEQVKAMLASQGLPTDYVDIPFTAFLAVTPAGRFLFDAGFGDNGPPTTGRLREHLAAAGFKPEDIDHVVISHFHGDHINGVRLKEGAPAFPRARIHVPAPEWAFWMDEARMQAAPQALQGSFQAVRRAFGGPVAERIETFQPGSELAPGIRAEAAFGHTPGMCVFTLRSQGQGFIDVADTANIPALFVRNPDWSVMFDMDAELARQTRRRILEQAARERLLVGGYHFPFPAFGVLEPAGSGWTFRPLA